MDLNFSHDSFAFSDIAPPSHVSDLESFSDFDVSEASETSFVEFAPRTAKEIGENNATSSEECNVLGTNSKGKFSPGLQELNATNIQDFLAAIKNAHTQGFLTSNGSRTSLVSADDSSLGILQLDALSNLSDNLQNMSMLDKESTHLDRTLVGDDMQAVPFERETKDPEDDMIEEDIPFASEYNAAGILTPVVNRNMETEKQRPDTGQDPDIFFSPQNEEINHDVHSNTDENPSQLSYGQEELRVMLQRRSGSGDGGELIDRVSLTSSISFIQSQTFPDSVFSQSFSSTSRGLGSGMDSRSGSDDNDDGDNTLPSLHGAGDGSNGSINIGRPGLEGANSDVEDPPVLSRSSLDNSARQETQGLGLRQSAEGGDVGPFVPGDGGGGGDGSSGNNSDADDGGPPVGSARTSSSTSSLPPTTIPTTAHQITSSSLQFTSSLHGGDEAISADRGCPVGDVDADRSPVLLPSPPNQLNAMAANLISTPYPIHLQATSTPLVKQEGQPDNSAAVHDQTSALESCYLAGKPGDFTFGNSFHPALVDGRSFGMPQAQSKRTANSLSEAESLNFVNSVSEAPTGHALMQDRDTTLMMHDSETRNVKGESLSSSQSDSSIKLNRSNFIDHSSVIDDSQLWKSTPRDDELSGTRATPGIVFKGHQRPSTVTGQAYFGDSETSLPFLDSQTIIEPGLERTLTPGMAAAGHHTMPQPPDWLTDNLAPLPWSPGEFGTRDSIPGNNPFDSDALPRGITDAPSWTLGMDSAAGGNPFDDEGFDDYQNSFNVGSDLDFQPQGDAAAILAADEEKFKKEHQFDLLPQAQINDVSKLHDWTIPDSHYVNRPSLLRVIGINDPNDLGEVRVSFGRFLAARSEELGSLSRTSPDRPRPTFGDDKEIITPPKQVTNVAEVSSTSSSVDKSLKENQHLDQRKADKSSQRLPKHNALQRQAGSRHGTRAQSDSVSLFQEGNPSLEMKKAQLDEQYRTEVRAKSRSRSNSQTSSRSSSSRSSVKSVIKNDSDTKEQTALSKRSAVDDYRSKGRSRKRSDRKDKKERHKSDQLSEVSCRSQDSGNQLQGLPLVSDKGFLNTVGRCLSNEDNAASLESLSQFIAEAINEDPDKIRRQLTAVANAKANAKLKKKQQSLSTEENIEKNSMRKSQEFNPLASSSPQSASSREKAVYTQDSIHVMAEVELPSSNTLEDSVFPLQDSPSQAPLSLKELDSKGSSPSFRESMHPSEKGIFKHVIPQFGETYTLRNTQNCTHQKQGVPVIDPLGHRAHEIEQRLDQSLPPNDQSYATNANPHPPSAIDVSTQYVTPGGRTQKLDTSFDSAVESMSSSVSKSTSVNRHSWPDTASTQQQKPRDITPNDHPNNMATSGSQETGYKTLVQRVSAPSEHQVTRPADPGPTIQNLRVAVQPQNQFPGAPPIQTSLLGTNSSIPATMATVFAGHTMPALSGLPCHNGPAIGQLSQTASAGLGSGVLPLGSITHPTQGFGMLNTLQNHVPFVQTVSANAVPKPSGLTPTYVQSFGSDIAYNLNTQQLPLHLRTGTSSIAVLPTSISQPTVHTSVPFMQTPLPQVNNGLLQVKPDLQRGTTLLPSTPVILPGDVKFPPVCCVGVVTETVIPLHNSSSQWMHCEIHSILSSSNGVQVLGSASAFSIQPKAIIAPHTTENVKISVQPKEPGTFMTQLEVYSFPVVCDVQPVAHSLGPVLALEVVAEEPRVEVLLEDSKAIDFGEVSSGSKHCKPLRLINRCRAQVPVRIIISANSSSLHCFAFARADFPPKTDVLVGPSVTMSKGSALTIHTLTLKGQLDMSSKVEPTIVWILFQSPKKGHADSSSSGQPDEHVARLDVEIDSAQQGPTISSILLKAQSGVVKLHTPHKLQVINLSASVGKRATRMIPVKNAGNITARVELKIEGDLQKFSVRPTQLVLKPEQESEVQLAYFPTEPDNEMNSTLVLTVPDGPVYEVLIKGSVVPEEDDSSVLLSSKPVLCWSGVKIGSSQQQKVVLKTSSTSPVKKLQLQIEGNHSDFQIQPTFHSLVDNLENPVVILGPQKELPVHVVFAPSSMGLISSALVIKSLTGKTKSKIPLYGCGGTSQLVLLDIRQLSEGYVANVGEVSLGKKNAIKITVRNSGTRAAFVKAVCYSDIHSLQLYPSSHLNIYPNNFVLSERTSKQIMIEYQPAEKDAVRCRKAVNSVAVVAFYTGDELFRQQYKYHLKRHPQQQPFETKEGSLLAGINFTSTFQDEDKLIEDVRYPKVPSWDNFFQGCVSRVLLTLVGSPPVSSAPNRSDPNSSVDIVPMSDNPVSAHEQHPVADGNFEGESWTVIPEHLILSPPLSKSDKGGSERLEIINFSERPLGFEFTWPAHSIVITPERGDIPPRSQTRVLVSAKSNLSDSRIQFPWAGTIYLKCDGSQKAIRVQIREELILDSSPYHPGSVSFQAIPTTTAGNTPLSIDHLPPLKIKNKDIEFVKTQIGKISTSEIVAVNTTPSDLRWDLSSLAPAYVKVDETGSIFRSTYPAFHVGRHSGSIESGQTIQIAVKFQPRNVGQYSQSWDLQILPSTSKQHHHFKQRISLHGQAVDNSIDLDGANDDADVPANVASKKVTIAEPPRSPPPPGTRKGLYLPEDVIQFPLTPVGQSSLARVKICNDSEDSYLVRAAPPSKPFFVQHVKFSVRPKRFVRLPVKFSPTEPGLPFETSLVFTAQPDIILTVKLQATSGTL